MTLSIGAIDVGSINQGNLGWAVQMPDQTLTTGTDLDKFIAAIAAASMAGPVALGFEAPLFLPFRATARTLHKGRQGEGSPSWIGKVGCLVATQCLPIMAYAFSRIRSLAPAVSVTFNSDPLPSRVGEFLIFEAFVAGPGKLKHRSAEHPNHVADAVCVVTELRQRIDSTLPLKSDIIEDQVFSLVGAALLRAGWSDDVALLAQQCLVVRPR